MTHHKNSTHSNPLAEAEHRIDQHLHHDSHNLAPVYHELEQLRKKSGSHFSQDLDKVNEHLRSEHLLPNMHIVDRAKHLGVTSDDPRVASAAEHIEQHLKKNPRDFKPVYGELDDLKKADGANFAKNLQQINEQLHNNGELQSPTAGHHLHIIQNGNGYSVIDDASDNAQHNAVVSNSHESRESPDSENFYKHMKHPYSGHNAGRGPGSGGGYDRGASHERVPGHSHLDRQSRMLVPTEQRKELIDKALELAGLPINGQNEEMINTIIQNESSWNANSLNDWDINAKQGQPTQGLMQTRPDVFDKFAVQGYNSNVLDPLSNIVAGIRYAEDRYGSLDNVPGIKSIRNGGGYKPY
jgi:phage-related protein